MIVFLSAVMIECTDVSEIALPRPYRREIQGVSISGALPDNRPRCRSAISEGVAEFSPRPAPVLPIGKAEWLVLPVFSHVSVELWRKRGSGDEIIVSGKATVEIASTLSGLAAQVAEAARSRLPGGAVTLAGLPFDRYTRPIAVPPRMVLVWLARHLTSFAMYRRLDCLQQS